jgi:hypothetical protein
MRNTVIFLVILVASACALAVTPWIWPNKGAVTYGPSVVSAAPSADQGYPSTPAPLVSPTSAKVATVARSVQNVSRPLGDTSAGPREEETVAFVVSNPYRPHWIIER